MIKILVIEDKNDHLGIVGEVLNADEFTVHYSHNKKDGIEIALRYTPDLILFHYNSSDNKTFIREIIDNPAIGSVPLLVISEVSSFREQRGLMEMGVEDYIPIEFLSRSIEKSITARLEKFKKSNDRFNEQMDSFEFAGKKNKNEDHILVKIGRKLKLIKFSDIVCITALKEYSKIKTCDNMEVLVRKSMRNWCKIIPSESFLRIHRATIINLNYIDTIKETPNHKYTVSLKGVTNSFDFSYRYANIMRRTFPT